MVRRNFIKDFSLLATAPYLHHKSDGENADFSESNERKYWLATLLRIATPVVQSMSNNRLKEEMPVEGVASVLDDRKKVTHLEALGRTLAGLAPWLEGSENTETIQREKFISMSVASIRNAVTPSSSGYLNFTEGAQPLVDAAFLAHALIRAPKQLWGNLDSVTQAHLVRALQSTRAIKPYNNNWLLFTAMIEAALLKFTKEYDTVRVDHAVNEHKAWYKGDGVYGDGPELHVDYYNSFVIHPMLIDTVRTVSEETGEMKDQLGLFIKRAQRYSEILERQIAPDGSFPPVGRSLAYRCGAFQLLAQMSLQKQLPISLKPAQVRNALTAVIRKTISAQGTFDKNGWLTIGLCGHQPGIGERYISTGSLYLCTAAFLPLGLPMSDEFWSAPQMDWTSKKAFSGGEFPIDKAVY